MKLDQNPVFRKIIVPWYDSTAICGLVIAAMLMIILFAIAGIVIAIGNVAYQDHVWVPLVILLLSASVVGLTIRRLVLRFINQRMAS